MTFRTRLLLVFAVTIVSAVAMVVFIVSASTERAFERFDRERTAALVQQFQKEFAQRGEEVARAAERIAASETMLRIAVDANRPEPDYSLHVNDASTQGAAQGLDFLELVAANGSIASAAPSTARYAYQENWLTEPVDWKAERAFLRREELTNEPALALEAVRVVTAGDNRLYVVAGRRLDQTFLSSLVLPSGTRALLYPNLEPAFSVQALAGVSPDEARKLKTAPRRGAMFNRGLKTSILDWGFSDAMMAVGSMHDVFREGLRQLFLKSVRFSANGSESNDWEQQLKDPHGIDREFVVVSHSLGSQIPPAKRVA